LVCGDDYHDDDDDEEEETKRYSCFLSLVASIFFGYLLPQL
jgi:hypothetical protein